MAVQTALLMVFAVIFIVCFLSSRLFEARLPHTSGLDCSVRVPISQLYYLDMLILKVVALPPFPEEPLCVRTILEPLIGADLPTNCAVDPFLETMHLPLLAGRTLTETDLESSRPVAVVNRTFVKQYLNGRNPLGLHFGDTNPKAPQWEIVGVMEDAKYSDLREAIKPTAYVPLRGGGAHFELRTAVNPVSLIPAVRRVVSEADSNLPLFSVRTQSEQIDELLFNERLMARLSSLFGLLALVLACVGLYGLLAYEVTRRTREIGIRMALGAQQREVLRLVIRRGASLTVAGIAIGLAASAAMTRYLGALLYGVPPIDRGTFAVVVLIVAVVAAAACLIPARRATKVEPVAALRYE